MYYKVSNENDYNIFNFMLNKRMPAGKYGMILLLLMKNLFAPEVAIRQGIPPYGLSLSLNACGRNDIW